MSCQATITLLLRRRTTPPGVVKEQISREKFAQLYAADPADVEAVIAFAAERGLEAAANILARTVKLSGPLEQLRAFFRGGVPDELGAMVKAVMGSDRQPNIHSRKAHPRAEAQPQSFTPPQLAQIYNFPQGTGAGQTIAVIELDGGYNDSDLTAYWQQIGVPAVDVTSVGVDGSQNAPTGDPNGPDGEVTLDIQVAGGVAPGAKIVAYFGPNTDQGFLDAINAAIHDAVNKPSVISISWGQAEDQWPAASKFAFNAAFHDAAMLGITVLAAAGDNGSSDGDPTDRHVDFPASSPWVIACGGTSLIASGNTITSETAWNDGAQGGATGGGVSRFFSNPMYQRQSHVPGPPVHGGNLTGRGVPDVAAVADPETGYQIYLEGQSTVIGGTSAVAPLWAGLIAICNQQLGRNVGWIHPKLYTTVKQAGGFHDVTGGNNGAYSAIPGWDCCTGLGSPNGAIILGALKG